MAAEQGTPQGAAGDVQREENILLHHIPELAIVQLSSDGTVMIDVNSKSVDIFRELLGSELDKEVTRGILAFTLPDQTVIDKVLLMVKAGASSEEIAQTQQKLSDHHLAYRKANGLHPLYYGAELISVNQGEEITVAQELQQEWKDDTNGTVAGLILNTAKTGTESN